MYANITCQEFALILWRVNFVRVVNMLRYIPIIRYCKAISRRASVLHEHWNKKISYRLPFLTCTTCINKIQKLFVLRKHYIGTNNAIVQFCMSMTEAINHIRGGYWAWSHAGCWENTRKACKSSVLLTSQVGHCAGNPLENMCWG